MPSDDLTSRPADGLPPLVICAGVFSSGSTWIFNVTLEIIRHLYPDRTVSHVFSDEIGLPEEVEILKSDCLMIKSHRPTVALRFAAHISNAPVILSVREPRDAVASLASRFAVDQEGVARSVVESCDCILDFRNHSRLLLFKYEDGFIGEASTVEAIAALFDMTLEADIVSAILSKFDAESVKAYIESRANDGVFGGKAAFSVWDPNTHWHPSHLGDGRIGKWREILSPEKAAEVYYKTGKFREEYQYMDQQLVKSGEEIEFAAGGRGPYFIGEGYSGLEPWGIWTGSDTADLGFYLDRAPTSLVSFTFICLVGPCYRLDSATAGARIYINNNLSAHFRASIHNPAQVFLYMTAKPEDLKKDNSVSINFQFDGLLSGEDCGLAGDLRKLGLGLIKMRVDYEA